MNTHKKQQPDISFLDTQASKTHILTSAFFAAAYFVILAFFFPAGNHALFWLLIAGEVFHLWQLFTFLYTVWDMKTLEPANAAYRPPVDVFITVAGEPGDVIEETVIAAKNMDYPAFSVHILNDGLVARKDNWQEAEEIAHKHGVNVITRTVPGGAKAGNINNALRKTDNPFVVIFDADHVPHEDFLSKVMPYFSDAKVGFVQTPQYYKNHALNAVTSGAWEQQELFFGPICKGKNKYNAATMCGTNMAIRKDALMSVGGMCEESIAEDFITGLFLHQKGYKSVYVPEVLAEGLAPEDFLSYSKQQFRWARGALDMIFRYNPLFARGLSFAQRIQYLSSASFYLSGPVVLMNALIPLIFFFTGLVPIVTSTMLLAAIFLPYILITLYTLQRSSNFTYTFRSLAFSMSGFMIHIKALWSVLTGAKPTFEITSKKKIEGSFLKLVRPHIAYVVLVIIGFVVALLREGVNASIMANGAWAILNAIIFFEYIKAASPEVKADAIVRPVRKIKMAKPAI